MLIFIYYQSIKNGHEMRKQYVLALPLNAFVISETCMFLYIF